MKNVLLMFILKYHNGNESSSYIKLLGSNYVVNKISIFFFTKISFATTVSRAMDAGDVNSLTCGISAPNIFFQGVSHLGLQRPRHRPTTRDDVLTKSFLQ